MRLETCQILAGWLIDGSGKQTLSNVLITVTNGIIRNIKDTGEGLPDKYPAVSYLDLSEFTLVPPLVDSHVHLCLSGTTDQGVRHYQKDAAYSVLKPVMEAHLGEYTARGIVGIRDGGDYRGYSTRFKMEKSRTGKQRLKVKSAGRAWHAKGRYGEVLGTFPEEGLTLREAIAASVNPCEHVKVINSGLVGLKEFGLSGRPQFDFAQLKDAFEYAHEKGLEVMVHANGHEPVLTAVDAGCNSIEHGFFAGTENLYRMKEKGVFWIPTLRAMEALYENLPNGSEEKQVAVRTLEHQMGQVAKGSEIGVKIALGTDSGSIGVDHGRAVSREIRLFLEAGLTPEKIVHFAAFNGAAILGAAADTGAITEGGKARMIAIKGSPEKALSGYEEAEKRFLGF